MRRARVMSQKISFVHQFCVINTYTYVRIGRTGSYIVRPTLNNIRHHLIDLDDAICDKIKDKEFDFRSPIPALHGIDQVIEEFAVKQKQKQDITPVHPMPGAESPCLCFPFRCFGGGGGELSWQNCDPSLHI